MNDFTRFLVDLQLLHLGLSLLLLPPILPLLHLPLLLRVLDLPDPLLQLPLLLLPLLSCSLGFNGMDRPPVILSNLKYENK